MRARYVVLDSKAPAIYHFDGLDDALVKMAEILPVSQPIDIIHAQIEQTGRYSIVSGNQWVEVFRGN